MWIKNITFQLINNVLNGLHSNFLHLLPLKLYRLRKFQFDRPDSPLKSYCSNVKYKKSFETDEEIFYINRYSATNFG
jgi:hypothetical protein